MILALNVAFSTLEQSQCFALICKHPYPSTAKFAGSFSHGFCRCQPVTIVIAHAGAIVIAHAGANSSFWTLIRKFGL